MTLRALFAIMGITTFIPAVGFLILFRPPHVPIRSHGDIWWVSAALRLLASAVALGGFRIMVVSLINHDRPVTFTGPLDQWTAIVTVVLAALASLFFFLVYLMFRRWEDV